MPFPNCLLVIVHLLFILLTGIPLMLLVSWAVVENSFLVGEVNARTFTIMDVLSPNSVSPWWSTSHSGTLLLVFLLIFLGFYLLALL